MSSFDAQYFAEQARDRISEKSDVEAGVSVPVLISIVPDALNSLAVKVAGRDDYEELQKDVAVTAVSGVITIADTTVLIAWIVRTGQLVLNNVMAKPHESYDEITIRQPADVYHFAVRNRKIYVRDITTGLLGTCSQSGTLTVNYVPTLALLPERYERELVDEIVRIALSKVGHSGERKETPTLKIAGGN